MTLVVDISLLFLSLKSIKAYLKIYIRRDLNEEKRELKTSQVPSSQLGLKPRHLGQSWGPEVGAAVNSSPSPFT